MLQVDATPTCGLEKSAESKPTARSIALAGAFSIPSTTLEEYLRVFVIQTLFDLAYLDGILAWSRGGDAGCLCQHYGVRAVSHPEGFSQGCFQARHGTAIVRE